MNITFLDCETTYQVTDGKKDPSPYNPKNKLVSISYASYSIDDFLMFWVNNASVPINFLLFYHLLDPVSVKKQIQNKQQLQEVLNNTTELICHATKFDLAWLWESGFTYTGIIDCTMIRQYVLNRGLKKAISLEALGEQYDLATKKKVDLIQGYLDENISMENVPLSVLEPYNIDDIGTLIDLWWKQQQEFVKTENKGLIPTIKMMNEYTKVLIDMEGNGIKIDKKALQEVKEEYIKEQTALKIKIGKLVANVMGDTPVNLESPEQLSQLIYSRKVIDKVAWKRGFGISTEQKYRTK